LLDRELATLRQAGASSSIVPGSAVCVGPTQDGGAWHGKVLLASGDARSIVQPERILCCDTTAPGELMLGAGVELQGGTFDLSRGSIFLGEGCCVEPGAYVRGPAHFGQRCTVRHGAYVRGDVVVGSDSVVGGELKHMLGLEHIECPHYGYCGDALLGYKAHLGCGALTANLPLFPSSLPAVDIDGTTYTLGRRKFGAVLGDHVTLGCGCVAEPGCLVAPGTQAYPLCRLPRGLYGPKELIKHPVRHVRVPIEVR